MYVHLIVVGIEVLLYDSFDMTCLTWQIRFQLNLLHIFQPTQYPVQTIPIFMYLIPKQILLFLILQHNTLISFHKIILILY